MNEDPRDSFDEEKASLLFWLLWELLFYDRWDEIPAETITTRDGRFFNFLSFYIVKNKTNVVDNDTDDVVDNVVDNIVDETRPGGWKRDSY